MKAITPPVGLARRDHAGWVGANFGVALQTVSSPVRLNIHDLVGIALRRNPRRAHLLVSTVLGKHVAVAPGQAIGAGRLLGELVAQTLVEAIRTDGFARDAAEWYALVDNAFRRGDTLPLLDELDRTRSTRFEFTGLVLGFAETATGLGHLVADQMLASCYLHSTRRRVPGVRVAGTFEEGHSHATSHLLLPVPAVLLHTPGPLVLVDDELSTGRTAMATITEAHRQHPRAHYIVAALVDLRTAEDEAALVRLAERLGCRIDVVSLVRGTVTLPPGLADLVVERLPGSSPGSGPSDGSTPTHAVVNSVRLPWSTSVPDGGRHGFVAADRDRFQDALAHATQAMTTVIRTRLDILSNDSKRAAPSQILVIGTEEFMYLPLRLAEKLASDPAFTVAFQSTTRSPVHAVEDAGYPIRRTFSFADAEGDSTPRYLYNASTRRFAGQVGGNPDLVVIVTDPAADTPDLRAPTGVAAVLQAAGLAVELFVVGSTEPPGRAAPRARNQPAPLTGPTFGSYAPDEVQWLLTDLSDLAALEGTVEAREAAIQSGSAHYAESLPIEYQPDERYQDLFLRVLDESAERLALAVGRLTELVMMERGHNVVLASLARAGTPIGILVRRWAAFRYGLGLPHYALSIVRGRGIDAQALEYLAIHHDPHDVVFIDGWTGKGAIARELAAAIDSVRREISLEFNADLAVLADPGHCVRTFGTRDDFLIASACLNSTVSGLVSRTVLNSNYLRPGQFHGAKFYRELADVDCSALLLDTVTAAFDSVVDEVMAGLPALAVSDRQPTFTGWAAIETIRVEYGIESVNFVKPGVGETTRVLLRRVPWRILVRESGNPDHEHLELLARERGVPIEVRPDLPYSCVGLIRRLSTTDAGEG